MMPEEQQPSLEQQVLSKLMGAFARSRDVMEAERPEHIPPYTDDGATMQRWAMTVNRQGVILAQLSAIPETRAELMLRMPGLLNSAPAWLDADLAGVEKTSATLFLRGLAQTLCVQRAAIERVVAEQVADPERVEEALEEASPPPGTKDETQSELIDGVGKTMSAHMRALVAIAYDLEAQMGCRLILDD
jgi:hypothetical protein